MEHLTDVPLDDIIKKLKKHLIKRGEAIYVTYRKLNKECNKVNPAMGYLKRAYEYFTPDNDNFNMENDKWKISTIPFKLNITPMQSDTLLNFEHIKQYEIKRQVKEAALFRLKRLRPKTVAEDIYAMNTLSAFLFKNSPEIKTLADFTRKDLEEYLAYIYLESNKEKEWLHDLRSLKSLLSTIGKLFGFENLRGIFLKSDFPRLRKTLFKSYSDAELARLHEGYKTLDKQTARLMLVHELLGLRISDTLTMKQTDLILGDDPHIRIHQSKTNKTYVKKINNEIANLLLASIEYDNEHYGKCEFIFVSEKDPTKPMNYGTLDHRIKTMIYRLDLRDDNGDLFTIGTHIMRHTYGKRLCDLLNDDATIAALLGHSSTQTVAHYRKMSPNVLAETAKPVIDKRNEKIKQFKKGWME